MKGEMEGSEASSGESPGLCLHLTLDDSRVRSRHDLNSPVQ